MAADDLAARPANFTAGTAPGRRNATSDSAPIGIAASRRAGVTSFVTPPQLTNTRRSTICGYWYANCAAMPPPREWPTMVTRSMPSTVSRSRMPFAKEASE